MNPSNLTSSKILSVLVFVLICSIALTLWLVLSKQHTEHTSCGYESCPKSDPKKLNIHLFAHTHDQMWTKTFDQYYTDAIVYIFPSVIDSLQKDSNRRFVFTDVGFIWKWWQNQNEKKRQAVKKLINEGRIEIVGGGWNQNDEATPSYQLIIDQYTWGFRRLNDEFGTCARPKVGWQIDPYGHSREQAAIFAQMGFDGMFIGRLDTKHKQMRFHNKAAEFIWEGSSSLGKPANLFTSIFYNVFRPPWGFCFDEICSERVPIVEDPDDVNYNIHQRANLLVNTAKNQARSYRTKNIIFTMGGNGHYKKAELWFSNLDKMIKYINNKYNDVKIFYSTPSCYLKTLNDLNITWPVTTEDFFPYSTDDNTFWTGFYSSRPTLKFFITLGNSLLQVVKKLSVLSKQSDSKELQLYREAMGVMLHDDAISGTSQQHVAFDFAKILHNNVKKGENLASIAMSKWASKESTTESSEFYSCLLLNISSCDYSTDNKKFVVTVFNPTSRQLTTFVRVPVQKYVYGVKDFTGNDIVTQMVPLPESIFKIPGRYSTASMELVFRAVNISALGYQSFYVYRTNENFNEILKDRHTKSIEQAISGEFHNISVNARGKTLIQLSREGKDLRINQTFRYYEGAEGDNMESANRSSGSYVFRPKQNYSKVINETESVQTYKGPLVEEIHHVINNWISQVIRVYKDTNYIEFDWIIGPVPAEDGIGKEVITRFSSSLQNNGEFYTDSNGRQMMKRKLNNRLNWDGWIYEYISSNYYPVTSKISIEDKKEMLRMSVLLDRAQGGTSLKKGALELMVHRRLLYSDDFGNYEALNEIAYNTGLVVKGTHYLVAGSLMERDELFLQEKELADEIAARPWLFFTPVSGSFQDWNKLYHMKNDGLLKSLPKNVRVLTLEPWKEGEVLLRLEHFFEVGETRTYSSAAELDLKELFAAFTVNSVQEMTLGANQVRTEAERLKWNSEIDEVPPAENTNTDRLDQSNGRIVVHLNPMQIRTFILKLSRKNH